MHTPAVTLFALALASAAVAQEPESLPPSTAATASSSPSALTSTSESTASSESPTATASTAPTAPTAPTATPSTVTLAAEAPPPGWGFAGDVLTVAAGGVGGALGLVVFGLTYGDVATANATAGNAMLLTIPAVPALAAGVARGVQPNATAINVGLPAAGAALGTLGGGVAWFATQVITGSAINRADTVGPVGATVILLGFAAGGAALGTAGGVALAHGTEGE
jgi:hypothetical protein